MMMHTPGPWEISRDAVPKGHVQNTVYAEADGERVATVFVDAANARLIAAAPDLLEAVATMLGCAEVDIMDDKSNVWRSAMIAARHAIAKATEA